MVLRGNVCQVEACFGLFEDSVSVRTRQVHGLGPNVPRAWKSFWKHPMVLLIYVGQVEARFDTFRDSVNLGTR
jgi:hypothetical protein